MTQAKDANRRVFGRIIGRVLFIAVVLVFLSQLAIGPCAWLFDRAVISRQTVDKLEATLFLPVTYPACRSPAIFGFLKSYIALRESPPPPVAPITTYSGPTPIPVQTGQVLPPPIVQGGSNGSSLVPTKPGQTSIPPRRP